MTTPLADICEEGLRLLSLARAYDSPIGLLGGVAVRLHAAELPTALDREYKDLDFAVPKGGGKTAARLLEAGGYQPESVFNAMNAKERMLFRDLAHDRQVDVFIGSFRMCHEIPFTGRLSVGDPTVPLAELVLTKLQIVELNEKDVRDTVLLFHGHEVADHDDDAVNGARIAELCASDWGLWRTITANLDSCRERLSDYALPSADLARVAARLGEVRGWIDAASKSRAWRLRARVGERKRWYELPEEVEQ